MTITPSQSPPEIKEERKRGTKELLTEKPRREKEKKTETY